MSGISFLDALRVLVSENPLLARLFFASIEVTVLALAVAAMIRLARIRSPRVISLLWLVVLVKPIVSLALGSPVTIACLGPVEAANRTVVWAVEKPAAAVADEKRVCSALPGADVPIAEEPSRWAGASAAEPVAEGSIDPLAEALPLDESGLGRSAFAAWLSTFACGAWLAAVIFFVARYVFCHWKLRRIVAGSSAPPDPVAATYRSIASQLGVRRLPRLIVTEALDSPAIVGLFRPVILVPAWLAERGDCPELVWSLRHELTHWRWRDPAAIGVRDLATTLFAFHPFVWWAGRRQTESLELACDQAVLQNHADAADYAEQLYQILRSIRQRRRTAVAGGLFATRTQIGRRIAALLDGSQTAARRLTVFSVVGVLLLGLGALAVGGAVGGNADTGDEGKKDERPANSASSRTLTLRFPKTHRIGVVFSRPPIDDLGQIGGWEPVGPAQGLVTVPAGRDVQLKCTEPVSSFPKESPGDVQHFWFWYKPPDSAMEYMARCGRMKWLAFDFGLPSPASWKHFAEMRSLESLRVLPTDFSSSMSSKDYRNLIGYLEGLPSLRCLEVFGAQVTDDDLAQLRRLPRLEQYGFLSNRIHGPGLAHLAALPRLRQLMIRSESLTDGGLDALAGCKSLRRLTLYCPKLTAAGYAPLAKLTSLEELELCDLPLSDGVLAQLAGLRGLRKLNLDRTTGLTDAGLAHLGNLTSLEEIGFSQVRNLTDAGLVHLRRLTKMKRLTLNMFELTGAGLGPLDGMKELELLTLPPNYTDEDMAVVAKLTALKDLGGGSTRRLTNAGLAQLKTLKSLETLAVGGKNVTGSGLLALRGLPLKTLYWEVRLDKERLTPVTAFPQLEALHLGLLFTPLTGEDLAPLAKLTRLKALTISCRDLRGFDAALLAQLPSLEDLAIVSFETTDRDLKDLAKIKNLTRLQIRGDFSEEGLLELRGLKQLNILYVTMDKPLSREAQKRLQRAIPSLANLDVRKNPAGATRRPRAGRAAPTFSFVGLDGKRGQLKDYRGKVVLLHFWSTSCKPCVASMPGLKKSYDSVHQEHDDFVMLSLCVGGAEDAVRALVEKNQLTWPQICLSLESEVAPDYGVTKFPTYFLIDRDGKIVYDNNDKSKVKLRDALAKAFDKPS